MSAPFHGQSMPGVGKKGRFEVFARREEWTARKEEAMNRMKKWTGWLALAGLFFAGGTASAYTETVDGVAWRFSVEGGEATLTGIVPDNDWGWVVTTATEAKVPSMLGGYPVKRIGAGSSVFSSWTNLAAVTIPEGVEAIGRYAFSRCSSLKSVTLPASTRVDDYAFYNCNVSEWHYVTSEAEEAFLARWCSEEILPFNPFAETAHLVIPHGVKTIRDRAFSNCKLASVEFPSTLESIGERAFYWCSNLVSVAIPDGVVLIGDEAFGGCERLESVTLGEGVTRIGNRAFNRCGWMDSARIPAGVETIGEQAFRSRHGYNACLDVDEGNPSYASEFGVLYSKDRRTLLAAPQMGPAVFKVPDGVTDIADQAFSGCGWLESVVLPASVTNIGNEAFYGCTNLAAADIPEGVASIGKQAFSSCAKLASVAIPESVERIGSNAFQNCSAALYDTETVPGVRLVDGWVAGVTNFGITNLDLTGIRGMQERAFVGCHSLASVEFPDSLERIPTGAFSNCTGLASVSFGSGLAEIGDSAFEYCLQLASVEFPDSLESIGAGAFCNCTNMTKASFGTGLKKVGDRAFERCNNLTEAVFSEGLESIGSGAFETCERLTKAVIPQSVRAIADRTFSGCVRLESAEIPGKTKTIGEQAFSACWNLPSVSFPEGLTSIGKEAFSRCYLLGSVTIPASVTEIGEEAFGQCRGMAEIRVAADNSAYSSEDGILFDKDKTRLIRCPGGKAGLLTILPNVQRIEARAFYDCDRIVSVTISNGLPYRGVAYIGEEAFSSCGHLQSIDLGTEVKNIGKETLAYCTNLTSVKMSSGVTNIGERAFALCASSGMTLPSSLKRIGAHAFERSRWLGWVSIPGSVEEIGTGAFDTCTLLTDVAMEEGVGGIGNQAFHNCTRLPSVAFPESLKWIGDEAFSLCGNLASVDIPGGVELIGDEAFLACTNMASATIGGGLVGWKAFYGCTRLTTATMEAGVSGIGPEAFSGCTALERAAIPGSAKHIGKRAFYGCRNLADAAIPAGVESIGEEAFHGCRGLAALALPGSVTMVGNGAFSDCTGLKSASIPDSLSQIGDRVFSGCTGLASVEIADGVEKIGTNAFSGCTGLASAKIPDTVAEIGEGAFSDCRGLESVELGDGVACIGKNAFSGCTALASVEIPDGVAEIGAGAFSGCTGLALVEIPPGVAEIGGGAFSGCTGLEAVTVGGNIATAYTGSPFGSCSNLAHARLEGDVPERFFYNCATLGSVEIAEGAERIGDYAFYGCTNLSSVSIPDSVSKIGRNAFTGCADSLYDAESVPGVSLVDGWAVGCGNALPAELELSGARGIGDYAFYQNRGLKSVEMGAGIVHVGDYAFARCSALASVSMPAGLEGIGDYSFGECSGLASAVIPEGVTRIGSNAFYYCSQLASVKIPDSVTNIGGGAFALCTALTSVSIPSGVERIEVGTFGSSGLISVVVPPGVKEIGAGAFRNCSRLGTATLPDGLERIGNNAFASCAQLASIRIPGSVEDIGEYAFSGCKRLKAMTIPAGLSDMGKCVFYGCGGLESVEFGNGSKFLGEQMFGQCTNLTAVGLADSVERIGAGAFSNCVKLASVDIPAGLAFVGADAFTGCTRLLSVRVRDLASWCGIVFENEKSHPFCNVRYTPGRFYLDDREVTDLAIPEDVDRIGDYAFYRCSGLATATIPGSVKEIGSYSFAYSGLTNAVMADGVEKIGDGAFEYSGLKTVAIPGSVKIIGNSAFAGTGLNAVSIPEGVEDIGKYAFWRCNGLTAVEIPGSVTNIGWRAFESCGGLVSAILPESVEKVGKDAFAGCGKMERLYVPESWDWTAKLVGAGIPDDCTVVYGVPKTYRMADGTEWIYTVGGGRATILEGPSSGRLSIPAMLDGWPVAGIAAGAFSGCAATSVDIPEGVESIGSRAFSNCTHLAAVTIAGSVETIGSGVFAGCGALETLYAPMAWHGTEKLADAGLPTGCKVTYGTLERGIIDETVDGIGWVFLVQDGTATVIGGDCRGVAAIPGKVRGFPVTGIGDRAFSGCRELEGLTVSEGVEKVGEDAFAGCDALKRLYVPASWEGTEALAAAGVPEECLVIYGEPRKATLEDASVWTFTIADGKASVWEGPTAGTAAVPGMLENCPVVRIGGKTFAGCSNLVSAILSDVVEEVGAGAFEGCTGLQTLYVPAAWEGTEMLAEAGVPEGCEVVYGGVPEPEREWYYDVSDGKATVTGVTPAEGNLTIPETLDGYPVAEIGSDAFLNCTGLTGVAIAQGVETIRWRAFGWCSGLTAVEIPDSVKTVQNYAFVGCDRLKSVTIGAGLEILGTGAFDYCRQLAEFVVAPGNPHFSSQDGVLFSKTGDVLICCPAGKAGAYAVPAGVTDIQDSAFSECSQLSELTIPESVTSVGYGAFSGCTGLAKLEVPGEWWGTDILSGASVPEGCEVKYDGVERLCVATGELPAGTAGAAYEATLAATGGVAPYSWSLAAGEYEETARAGTFAETGTARGWQGDDECWDLALPFEFPFFGKKYSKAKINSNGAISFREDSFAACFYDENTFKAIPVIAVSWTDLWMEDIYTDGGENAVTVRWRGTAYPDGDAVNFSATLCKDGRIVLSYGEGNADAGAIGISAGDGRTAQLSAKSHGGSMENADDVVFLPPSGMPGWLELTPGGVLRGTPAAAGEYKIGVVVTDAKEVSASRELVLKVVGASGGEETSTTPVAVPHSWLAPYVEAYGGGDWEAAGNAVGKNGYALWESYVAGLDPEDSGRRFCVKIAFDSNGNVKDVTWEPDLREDELPRAYAVLGTEVLGPAVETWEEVSEENIGRMRYFSVKVGLAAQP